MSNPSVILKVAVLSTGHVREATAKMLDGSPCAAWPCVGGPYAQCGWFVYAHDENAGEGDQSIPDELYTAMTWARQQGAHYILFDRDADPVDALAYFDWSARPLLAADGEPIIRGTGH